ncbi:unnamed protein product [Rhizophagus irregularis]|nr:unnamed protein product [Rhizophagus irregularis]
MENQDLIWWASEEGKPRNQDLFWVGFRSSEKVEPRFVSFRWASEEGKPRNQDSFRVGFRRRKTKKPRFVN